MNSSTQLLQNDTTPRNDWDSDFRVSRIWIWLPLIPDPNTLAPLIRAHSAFHEYEGPWIFEYCYDALMCESFTATSVDYNDFLRIFFIILFPWMVQRFSLIFHVPVKSLSSQKVAGFFHAEMEQLKQERDMIPLITDTLYHRSQR